MSSERAFRERDAMLMRGDMDDETQMGRQEDGCDDDDSDRRNKPAAHDPILSDSRDGEAIRGLP